ncbi:MAG: 4-alpha-glucanotransferase [Leptospira sp.]|nr:4-alpha-glucanotransferase [Leptospira sp.]NCS94430.1 4-alpha-glucanotransferase [Leptospira sp.]
MDSSLVLNHPQYGSRRAGVCIALWSLLSEKSFECGDIYSLRALLPWLKQSGLSILQILPLNDCGIGQSPYSSLSSFAIDPLYISLHLAGIPVYSRKKKIATHKINKTKITELKINLLREKFDLEKKELIPILDSFIQSHTWMKAYLTFRLLYNLNDAKHWKQWKQKDKFGNKLYESTKSAHQDEFYFYAWLQYLAFEQLKETKNLFEKEGIYLKGDMPILTSSNSADVWANPELFRLDLQAGAPPDAFSEIGQNWGFPVLDWQSLEQLDYLPWKERLEYQENFFHLYRIDHVIGMYRIWAIPLHAKNARYGYFYPQKSVTANDFKEEGLEPDEFLLKGYLHQMDEGRYYFHWDFHKEPGFYDYPQEIQEKLFKLSFQNLQEDETYWRSKGDKVLAKFSNFTKMLPCAEDLGSVPGFVRESLQEKEILGIDVIRWTRSFEDGSYIPADKYRSNAVATLSTHDTSLAMDWWLNELKDGEKAYAESFFLQAKEANNKDNPIDLILIQKSLLQFSFETNSLYCIHLLHDLLFEGKEAIHDDFHHHKINTPGTIESKNWNYRFNFTIEDLEKNKVLSSELKAMIVKSKRIQLT